MRETRGRLSVMNDMAEELEQVKAERDKYRKDNRRAARLTRMLLSAMPDEPDDVLQIKSRLRDVLDALASSEASTTEEEARRIAGLYKVTVLDAQGVRFQWLLPVGESLRQDVVANSPTAGAIGLRVEYVPPGSGSEDGA